MAAGLGLKTFVTGDVLTAADTNGYLMQGTWVFADAAARTAAVTSPQEGNMSYLKDTNSVEYYSGSAWTAVGSGGLTKISSGTFTGVSSISLPTSSFSATYTKYRVVFDFNATSGTATVTLRTRTSGSDNTGSIYYYGGIYIATTGGLVYPQGAAQTSIGLGMTTGTISRASFSIDVTFPLSAGVGRMAIMGSNDNMGTMNIGAWTDSIAYDSLSVLKSAGTFGGQYSVYGYQN